MARKKQAQDSPFDRASTRRREQPVRTARQRPPQLSFEMADDDDRALVHEAAHEARMPFSRWARRALVAQARLELGLPPPAD